MSDVLNTIRDFAPVQGRHPDARTWQGYLVEAKVAASAALKPRNTGVTKFLIMARARSGTTLLTDLLGAHPNVTCDREVLAKKVMDPRRFLNTLARKSTSKAYGAKLLSYQMVLVQDFRDPKAFLSTLQNDGFKLIHLSRDTFAQTVSLTRAQASQYYHSTTKNSTTSAVIDPEEFLRRLTWNAKLAEYEAACLQDLNHLALRYEDDLSNEDQQETTANRVFDFLDLPHASVSTRLKKVLPTDPKLALQNYAEISAKVTEAQLGHLLPIT
ncbi:MAG: sulfotransferase domain-containing protein [Pseudomonadota bacterium]